MSEKIKIDQGKLNKLAELSVTTGVALQSGQDLLLTAPIEALPLVRLITKHAYKAGAGLVTPLFSDPEITLSRYNYAPDDSFDKAADWLYNGMGEAFDSNTARMAIVGDDPMLLSEQDPEKVGRANKANSIAYKPASDTDILPEAIGLFFVLSTCLSKFLSTISLTIHPAERIKIDPDKNRNAKKK